MSSSFLIVVCEKPVTMIRVRIITSLGLLAEVDPAVPTCPVCKRTFATVGSLQRHVELHIPNSKRFACSVCGFKFRRLEHIRAHVRSLHPAVAASGELYKDTGARRTLLSVSRRPRSQSRLPMLTNDVTTSGTLSLSLCHSSSEVPSSSAKTDWMTSRQNLTLPCLPASQGTVSPRVDSEIDVSRVKLEPTNS